ncbi:hypothetical protein [Mycobacterium sp. CnD-18-1]|uniref:hypothetical protein n=1 Tax=Mycobacterium sp. CnD-18-1 TaxID=2917744 RepID=UPI001EF2C9FA|nr:hypothetical protein [Mycobacterium sp. CnD-18-1]MCG7607177.1 hypothetical protein [Mycobacterium sp. CnD-18-1]
MSVVTLEEVNTAATIVNRLIRSPHVSGAFESTALIAADTLLREMASRIESEQEKRVEELADVLFDSRYPHLEWLNVARAAIDFLEP